MLQDHGCASSGLRRGKKSSLLQSQLGVQLFWTGAKQEKERKFVTYPSLIRAIANDIEYRDASGCEAK